MYDAASTILAQKLSQVDGVGQVTVGGSSLPAVRVELNPHALNKLRHRPRGRAHRARRRPTPTGRRASVEDGDRHWQIYANDQAQDRRRVHAARSSPTATARRCGCRDVGDGRRLGAGPAQRRAGQRQAGGAADHQPPARRQHHRDGRPRARAAAAAAGVDPAGDRPDGRDGPHDDDPRVAARRRAHAASSRSCW